VAKKVFVFYPTSELPLPNGMNHSFELRITICSSNRALKILEYASGSGSEGTQQEERPIMI